jgi:hypothetical protein
MPSPSTSGRPAMAATTNGRGGIDPPRLAAEHRVDLPPKQLLERAESVDQLLALRQLFGHHRRGAHHADGDDQRVIGQLVDIDEVHRAVLLDRLLGHQLADIGVAAAAGPEDGAARGDVFHVLGVDGAKKLHDMVPLPQATTGWGCSGLKVSSG